MSCTALASETDEGGLNRILGFQPPEKIEFDMYRGDSHVGDHIIRFQNSGDGLEVDISINFDIRFLGFSAYEYKHSNQEIWDTNGLVRIQTETDDNGDPFKLSAYRKDNELEVTGTKYQGAGPFPIIPTSYWHPSFLKQQKVLNTQNGEIMDISITPIGPDTVTLPREKVAATHYQVDGDLKMDIWYDDQGNWVKLKFDAGGTDMVYRIKSSASGRVVQAAN